MARRFETFGAVALVVAALCGATSAAAERQSALAPVEQAVEVQGTGTLTFEFDQTALAAAGLRFVARGEIETGRTGEISFPALRLAVASRDNGGRSVPAEVQAVGGIAVVTDTAMNTIGNFVLASGPDGVWSIVSTLDASGARAVVFDVPSAVVDGDAERGTLAVVGELALNSAWANTLGRPELSGTVVGRVLANVASKTPDRLANPETDPSAPGGVATSVGPDVIVGDVPSVQRWGRVGDITAYSIGTTSCNIGTERLDWYANINNHPVIAQNMYRLRNGRFEQIGMSWLKHGFFALSQNLCMTCNDPTDGTQLGVGCSDPYTSGLNGEQPNLGPRYEVNASNGFYPYPWSAPAAAPTVGRRLQVRDADLDPELNTGAQYFVEGHYITPSDAAQGGDDINNANNNASYRRVTVSEAPPPSPANVFNVNVSGSFPTQREKAGIIAWRDFDTGVTISNVDVPTDGRLILGHKVTDLGNNTWHYEYAVQNLNSDRSAGSFSLPIAPGVVISNVGFHGVSDHSGAPYDAADWSMTVAGGRLTWSTTPYDGNPNSNALRWGSLYNFRFDANSPPTDGAITLGLFKPGEPAMVDVTASVPEAALALLSSDPPQDSIDARQPTNLDGTNPQGWQFVNLAFNGFALALSPEDLSVVQLGGTGEPPVILALLPVNDNTVTAVLSRAVSVGAWTTIGHPVSGSSTRLGYLPGDVNGDGVSSPVDILALIDAINEVGEPRGIWSTDVDRSGAVNGADVLRVIDLLNGAGEFDVYNGATLP